MFFANNILTGEPTHCTSKVQCISVTYINYCLKSKVSIAPHLSATYVQPITKQELLEKHLCNQGSHYEKCRWFPLQKEAIRCCH